MSAVIPSAPEVTSPAPPLESLLNLSAKRTRDLFLLHYGAVAMDEAESQRVKLTAKIHDEYDGVRELPAALQQQQKASQRKKEGKKSQQSTIEGAMEIEGGDSNLQKMIEGIPAKEYVSFFLSF